MMKGRVGRPLVMLVVVSVTLAVSSGVAFAYALLGGKWESVNDLAWRWASSSYSTLGNDMAYAISDWDATNTDIGFTNVSSNEHITGYGYSAGDNLDGYADADPGLYSGTYQHGYVYLNWNYLYNKTGPYRRGTAGHEIGHTLGLAHVTVTALMNIYRNRETIYYPQTDDVNGINSLYPRN